MGSVDTASAAHRRFRVFRFKRGDRRREHFDIVDVPVGVGTTVLDALIWIQRHRDPTLALRHSCHHASCGTCGVLVNGREALACVTPVSELSGDITVSPLANIPILTDLVGDMRDFYARFGESHPLVRTSELLSDAEAPSGLAGYVRFEDCLECGLCLSACPVAATSRNYLGPAALVAACRLVEEPRGKDRGAVLERAGRPEGVWGCHAAFECEEVCPVGARPAERIMALRGTLLRDGPRTEGA